MPFCIRKITLDQDKPWWIKDMYKVIDLVVLQTFMLSIFYHGDI
jgi:hypothetical protein